MSSPRALPSGPRGVLRGAIPAAAAVASLALAARVALERDRFPGKLSLLGHCVAPAILGIAIGAAVVLRPALRGRLTALVAAIAIAVYAAEIAVRALIPLEFPDIGERSRRALAAGVVFDRRSQFELANDMRRGGERVYPMVSAATVMETGEDGHIRSAIRASGREVVPFGGVSRVETAGGNESGVQHLVTSDEMGFNNPPGLWDGAPADVMLVGDSFTFGWGVAADHNLAAPLRARFPRTVNLGVTGLGPLAELGELRELGPALRPRIAVMLFYEGNDMRDLGREATSPLLLRYLDPAFRQDLVGQHEAIDRALIAFADGNLAKVDSFGWKATQVLRLGRVRALTGFDFPARSGARPDFDLLRRVLHAAAITPAAWGGRLWFVFLPQWSRFAQPEDARVLDRTRGVVLAAARAEGMPIIDGVDVLAASGDPLASFPYRLGGHYSEQGYRLLGEAILARILATDGG